MQRTSPDYIIRITGNLLTSSLAAGLQLSGVDYPSDRATAVLQPYIHTTVQPCLLALFTYFYLAVLSIVIKWK